MDFASKVRMENICLQVFLLRKIRQRQRHVLSPLLFNFALEYAIRKVREANLGLDMNGTQQVLAYADDVNLIGDVIRTVEINADVQLDDCKILVSNKYREN